MGEVGQRPILGIVVFLIMVALLLFDRELLIDLAQQSYFIIIAFMLGFLYLATRSKTSTQEPVYSTREQFSATINTPNISKSVLKDETHKWIDTKRIFVTIHIMHEDKNSIQIKSPVNFISAGLAVRWTPNPMMIYYITFIYKENQIEVNAEVEYPQYNLLLFFQKKSPDYFGVLKCSDFILTFFKQIGISEYILFRELYSKSELEAYFKEEDNALLRSLLIILGLMTVMTFFVSGNIFDVIYADISGGLFFGVFIFGTARLRSRKYRHILSHYLKDEDSTTFN